jgi:hypothetical protein
VVVTDGATWAVEDPADADADASTGHRSSR